MFCPKCGNCLNEDALYCNKCGNPIKSDVEKSENRKESINHEMTMTLEQQDFAKEKKGFSIKKLISTVAIVLGIIIIICACSGDGASKPNFENIYNKYCSALWAEYGGDGSYLSIDTNPYDYEDEGMYYIEAYYAVKNINTELGLPSSLIKEMEQTTWSMGKQIQTYKNVIVTWTYHPDMGLEVIYSLPSN